MLSCKLEFVVYHIIYYNIHVPVTVIFALFFLLFWGIIFLYYKKNSYSSFFKNVSWCILMGYVLFIVSETVLFRTPKVEIKYYLSPLWTYGVLYNRMLAENILNILMFIPIGFLTSVGLGVKKTITILCVGFMLSVAIEVIQLVTRRGICNIDDVIHNTIGCIIGYGLFRLFYMMKPWLQCKLKTT